MKEGKGIEKSAEAFEEQDKQAIAATAAVEAYEIAHAIEYTNPATLERFALL